MFKVIDFFFHRFWSNTLLERKSVAFETRMTRKCGILLVECLGNIRFRFFRTKRTVTIFVTRSIFQIDVLLNEEHIQGSPFVRHVVDPGVKFATECTVSGDGILSGMNTCG